MCHKWIDVRAFGQLFAYKAEKKGEGVSVGIRGPISVHPAFSVAPVLDRISSIQITKSVSGEGEGEKRASDTMGMKHRVDHGVYVFYGSMNPQLATKTGFSDDDAQAVKEALCTMFVMTLPPHALKAVWKFIACTGGNMTAPMGSIFAKVHRLLKVEPASDDPKSIEDYNIALAELPDLKYEVIEGE